MGITPRGEAHAGAGKEAAIAGPEAFDERVGRDNTNLPQSLQQHLSAQPCLPNRVRPGKCGMRLHSSGRVHPGLSITDLIPARLAPQSAVLPAGMSACRGDAR